MKVNLLVLMFILALNGMLPAQSDSTVVPPDLNIADAVFLTHDDFRHNYGILKEKITSGVNKEALDFVTKVMEKETFAYSDGEKINTIETKNVWGYVQNKTLYINYRGLFYRIPVFGSVCYLVATVEVQVGFYDPMFGPGMGGGGKRLEVREFLVNYYDGIMNEFTMEDAEILIARDKTLYTEFKKLSRHKQKEQIFRYIRKYNEAHPIHFLK